MSWKPYIPAWRRSLRCCHLHHKPPRTWWVSDHGSLSHHMNILDVTAYINGPRCAWLCIFEYTKTSTIWATFCRRHFQLCFLDWKCLYHHWNSMKLVHNGPMIRQQGSNNIMGSIGSGDDVLPSGNKPLPEPVLTKFLDAAWSNMTFIGDRHSRHDFFKNLATKSSPCKFWGGR